LNNVAIRRFDTTDVRHHRLVSLSQRCHNFTADGKLEKVVELEAEIDEIAANIWGITDDELSAIQSAISRSN
jgi:hypothetical protein